MSRRAKDGKTEPTLDGASDDQLFTVEQTARFLQISDWLVRKHVRENKMLAVFIDGMTRIRAGDIRAYIAERRTGQDEPFRITA